MYIHIYIRSCIHIYIHIDPYEDQFEKRSEVRKERIAKNEYQRLRNIAKTEKSGRIKGKMM